MTYTPDWLYREPGDLALIAAIAAVPESQIRAENKRKARHEARNVAQENVADRRQQQMNEARFTPDTQPRDIDGRFRKILARLKTNLGGEATQELAKKIESTEAAQVAGNYDLMRQNGGELVKMIDDIQDGDIKKGLVQNLRKGSAELGKILAYLPLPQGNANAKVRFTDLPPPSSDLIMKMVKRVEEQLGNEDAQKYVAELKQFMAGSRTMASDEIAANLSKLLRVLA